MKFVTISSLALAVAAAASELNVMNSVAVPRDAYTALSEINAAFQLPVTNGQSALAGLTMKTTKPTLNLANFEHVSQITCLDSEIQITFDDAAHLQEAHGEWSTTENLTLLVPHENKCHGNEGMASYSVKKIEVDGLKMLVDFEAVPVTSVVDTFTLEVVQTKGETPISKRGLFDWTKDNTDVHSYGFNYDDKTQAAVQSPIQFAVTNSNKFFCTECYAAGKSGIHTIFKGRAFVIDSYEINLFGDFKVNMDVELFINVAGEIEFRKNLMDIPFLNIGIPGIFTVGPEVQLDAAISYFEHDITHLKFGFDYHMNYDFTVKSDQGILHKPTISAVAPGVFNPHPYTYDNEYQIKVAAHLIPIIDIGAHIFGGDAFQIGVEMDNQIGLEFDTGSFNFCPTNELGIRLYEEVDINLYAKQLLLREEYNLWSYQKTLWTNCRSKPQPTTTINKVKTSSIPTTTQVPIQTTTIDVTTTIPVVVTTTTAAAQTTTTVPCDTTTTDAAVAKTTTTTNADIAKTTTTVPCDTTTTTVPVVQTTTTTNADIAKTTTTVPCDTTTTDAAVAKTTTTTNVDVAKTTTTVPCDTTGATTTTNAAVVHSTVPCDTTSDIAVTTAPTPGNNGNYPTPGNNGNYPTPGNNGNYPTPGNNGKAPSPVYTNTPSTNGDIPKAPTYGNGDIPKAPVGYGNGDIPKVPAVTTTPCEEDIPQVTAPCTTDIPVATTAPAYGGSGPIVSGASAMSCISIFVSLVALVL
ncbi:hypothetical protein HDV06_005663 [Boothiomyces sp. JEL0866]|nr:hypothetical protein HDV06_005663 [Boothiomyces sp. JEL0866]